MIILTHVILALLSLALSTTNYFIPTKTKLTTSYILAIGTLASGVVLIVANNASVLRTCLTGIAFFGVVTILNEFARKKIAQHES